jgi:6-phosphogluconate dehydrogenase
MLRGNFLIGIGFKGLRFKEGDGIKDDRGIVEDIEDKVTQDVDLSEVSCTIYMFRTKLT